MTNERKMELIGLDDPEGLTAEEQAFIDKAWDDMTEEEKELHHRVYERRSGTIENAILNSGTKEEIRIAVRVLARIREECPVDFAEDGADFILEMLQRAAKQGSVC